MTVFEGHRDTSMPGLLQRSWKALLRPGTRLMNQLRLPAKLAVLVAAMAIPIGVFLGQTGRDLQHRDTMAHAAAEGSQILEHLIDTHASVLRLRGFSLGELSGEARFAAAAQAERTRVQTQVAKLDAAFKAATQMPPVHHWPGLMQRLQEATSARAPKELEQVDANFSGLLDDLQRTMHDVADRSRLADIAGSVSRQLTSLILDDTLEQVRVVSELGTQGAMLLAQRDNAGPFQRGRTLGVTWTLNRNLLSLANSLSLLARHGVTLPGSWSQAADLAKALVDDSRSRFASEPVKGSPTTFLEQAETVVDQFVAVQHDVNGRLAQVIAEEARSTHHKALWLAAAWLGGTLLLAYIVLVYFFAFQGALRELLKGMQATAQGDLSRLMKIRGRDELAEIARAFDQMNERLSDSTSDIRSRAARVDQSGRQVADGSQQLAQRTDEQFHSVNSAVAAVGHISSAVAQNAKATRELDELTERLFVQAEEGNAAMSQTVMAMDELQSASARVNEMVAVIDDVAFHTGMLALNASVEAARAGVAGKGFAVVAGEVRQLALRCAEASDEIRLLINASGAKVDDSSRKLQHACAVLDILVNGVREVSGQLRLVAAASTQQSASLQEVEVNISSLEHITRDNASLVEVSTTASQTLVAQGQALTASVAGMRLRHGSSDEARAMVERAVAYAAAHGRDPAMAHFNSPTDAWVDRDLFIFCLDRNGNILANALSPLKVGLNVNTLDGVRGTHHSDRLWERAEQGTDPWVRYQIAHPRTGKLRLKETYVARLDDNTLVACGCYGKAADETPLNHMPGGPVAWSRKDEITALAVA